MRTNTNVLLFVILGGANISASCVSSVDPPTTESATTSYGSSFPADPTSGAVGTSVTASSLDVSGGSTSTTTGQPQDEATSTMPTTNVDIPRPDSACDVWIQDCPLGQKCASFGESGDSTWKGSRCVDVAANAGGAGDACSVSNFWNSGEDTCSKGMMCWHLDDSLSGHCLPLCEGSPLAPQCQDPLQYCQLLADDINAPELCVTECDPLSQDCPGSDICIMDDIFADRFNCIPEASPSDGLFEDCALHSCAAGLVCQNSEFAAVECESGTCCVPFCDLAAPACPGENQVCSSWFIDPPPKYANVGVCNLVP